MADEQPTDRIPKDELEPVREVFTVYDLKHRVMGSHADLIAALADARQRFGPATFALGHNKGYSRVGLFKPGLRGAEPVGIIVAERASARVIEDAEAAPALRRFAVAFLAATITAPDAETITTLRAMATEALGNS